MRKKMIATLSPLVALCACAETVSLDSEAQSGSPAATIIGSAQMLGADGTSVGMAALIAIGQRLELRLDVKGLEPGTHALHLHTTGACEAPDFTSAGGHLNPTGATHGKLSAGGQHLGDLPNIVIPSDGAFRQALAIDADLAFATSAIFDADGTAVMLHAGADDYQTDPAGAAGPRIACGVIKKK